MKKEKNMEIGIVLHNVRSLLDPISKTPSSRVARDFPVFARRGDEAVAVATATEPQRMRYGKITATRRDTANFG